MAERISAASMESADERGGRSSTLTRRARRLATSIGLPGRSAVWRGLATREYRRKLRSDARFRGWWDDEGSALAAGHWAHETVEGEFDQLHVGSQVYEITELLRRRVGELSASTVLDAGASDGFFLARIGAKHGIGVNFLMACAAQIQSDGASACVGDIETLPFAGKSFEHVLCCETLEHVWNPIAVINELARVSSRSIHITIPWLPKTRISAKPEGWPEVESHIFEFSEQDFARVLSHANVRVKSKDRVHVFPRPRNRLLDWWLGRVMYPSYFPMLQYYELEPTK